MKTKQLLENIIKAESVLSHGDILCEVTAASILRGCIAALEADIAKPVEAVGEWRRGDDGEIKFTVIGDPYVVNGAKIYTTPQEPAAGLMPVDLLRVLADFEQYNAGDDEFGFMPTTGRIQVAADKARAMLAGGAA